MQLEEIGVGNVRAESESRNFGSVKHHPELSIIDKGGVKYLVVERFGYEFFVQEESIPGGVVDGGLALANELLATEDWLFVERMLEPFDVNFPHGLNGSINPCGSLYSSDILEACDIHFSGEWVEMINDPEVQHPFGIVTIELHLPHSETEDPVLVSIRLSLLAPFVGLYFPRIHPWGGVYELMLSLSSSTTLLDVLLALDTYFFPDGLCGDGALDPCLEVRADGICGDILSYIVANRLARRFSSEEVLAQALATSSSHEGYVSFIKMAHSQGWVRSLAPALAAEIGL